MAHFNEDLFGCLSDFPVCLRGCFCPFCTQACAVDQATGTGCIVPFLIVCCLECIGGAINRGKIRERYSIEGSFVTDCLIWWCCGPCAACQEYREVLKRAG